ncbi:hypothetical protein [Nonomuraea typhae]|uniref:hypothetical protein n=1 Tax=Nonomuraea typhae TaxID=2603600 RepID=UPI0012FBF7C9|nr:hypothetical protein [Nonomuraea typhae]
MTDHAPYTYISVALTPKEDPFVAVSFHDAEMWIRATVLADRQPLLHMSCGKASVSVSTTGAGPVSDADVTTARTLFEAASRYLADCERLHAEQATAAA